MLYGILDDLLMKIKVTTVGNSTGITLPKEVLNKLGVAKGDNLYLYETEDGYKITSYNEDLINELELAKEIMREDKELLRVLAKK